MSSRQVRRSLLRRTAPVAVLVLIPVLLGMAAEWGDFVRTNTPSLPAGIYRLTHNTSDPLISFCPTGQASIVSSSRHYREESWTRACPDDHAPLLKPVVAREGDVVTISTEGISVNGQLLRNSKSYPYDHSHLPMNPVPHGTYPVAPGTVWVVSSYNKASYDSRYIGPVQTKDIRNYGHPVWQF